MRFQEAFSDELEKVAVTLSQLGKYTKGKNIMEIPARKGILGWIQKKIPGKYHFVGRTEPGLLGGAVPQVSAATPEPLKEFIKHHEAREVPKAIEAGGDFVKYLTTKAKRFASHRSPRLSVEDYNIMKTLPEARGKLFDAARTARKDEVRALGRLSGLSRKELARLGQLPRLPKATKKMLRTGGEKAYTALDKPSSIEKLIKKLPLPQEAREGALLGGRAARQAGTAQMLSQPGLRTRLSAIPISFLSALAR